MKCVSRHISLLTEYSTSCTNDKECNLQSGVWELIIDLRHDIPVGLAQDSGCRIFHSGFPRCSRKGPSWFRGLCPRQVCYYAVSRLVMVSTGGLKNWSTSEKAGAAIFLYLFHSSPSEATMLLPKNKRIPYWSTGLGNLDLEDVIICASKCYTHIRYNNTAQTLIAEASATLSVTIVLGKAETYLKDHLALHQRSKTFMSFTVE